MRRWRWLSWSSYFDGYYDADSFGCGLGGDLLGGGCGDVGGRLDIDRMFDYGGCEGDGSGEAHPVRGSIATICPEVP